MVCCGQKQAVSGVATEWSPRWQRRHWPLAHLPFRVLGLLVHHLPYA
jgi:hypothetical protein